MSSFRPAEKHGPVTAVFPDLFMVTGRYTFMPGCGITRNMFIARQGEDLVIVSSMRLSPEGERELEKLGNVRHVVRIGGFHGADDPYYLDRYGATFWAPAGLKDAAKEDQTLAPGSCPIEGADVFLFKNGQVPEACLVLPREGGILITADCYQNWTTFKGCTLPARLMLPFVGFGPAVIGGPWAKRQGDGVRADFDRLMEVEFKHLLPGHGTVLKSDAKERLPKAIKTYFGR